MNVNQLTNEEAKAIVSRLSAVELLKKYTPVEIDILTQKVSRLKIPLPPSEPQIAIPHSPNIVHQPAPAPVHYANLADMAKNFGKAMIDSAKTGFRQVSDEVYKQRISICRTCPHWQTTPMEKCKVCGCTTAKHRLASSRCPLNPPKWNKIS